MPHHCIDLVDPGERYDAARYRRDATAAIAGIAARGRRAIVVGGTGLYVRALLDGLDLDAVPGDSALRRELEALPASEVFERLRALDPEAAAIASGNARRAVRYLEIASLAGSVGAARHQADQVDAIRVGLAPPREVLAATIAARVRTMVEAGVLEETRTLLARGLDADLPSMTGHGYVHWAAHLAGALSLDEAIARTVRDTRAYARRQMTWFRRDPHIRWYDPTRADPLPDVIRAAAA